MKNQIITIAGVTTLGLAKNSLGSRSIKEVDLIKLPILTLYAIHNNEDGSSTLGFPRLFKLKTDELPGILGFVFITRHKSGDSFGKVSTVTLVDPEGTYGDWRTNEQSRLALDELFRHRHKTDDPNDPAPLRINRKTITVPEGIGMTFIRRQFYNRTAKPIFVEGSDFSADTAGYFARRSGPYVRQQKLMGDNWYSEIYDTPLGRNARYGRSGMVFPEPGMSGKMETFNSYPDMPPSVPEYEAKEMVWMI
jgi:hypothetical protein